MIELTALIPANPQAVFASFGLLRVLAEADIPAKLAWRDGVHAELHGVEFEMLCGVIKNRLDEKRPELNWADSVKKFTRYQELMADPNHHPWLQAFWLEAPDKVEETKLDMTAGGQKLFSVVRAIIKHVHSQPIEQALRRTLIEPWDYADRLSGLGFDPGAVRSGATITGGKSPSSAPHATMALANLFAFEAMPLFPARWLGGTSSELAWVLPHRPVGLGSLRQMLLAAPDMRDAELEMQGWSRWCCRVGRNASFGYLYPAARISSDGNYGVGSRSV
ncbi:MAG: hypothetical protein PHE55_14440 [Methylococcaceae bacterium]|nr:hypothetical protein [Methylococcaceae bacterium]